MYWFAWDHVKFIERSIYQKRESSTCFLPLRFLSFHEFDAYHPLCTTNHRLDPIWTVKTGSLFLLETKTKDLFRCFDGIRFEVWDYDFVGSGSLLGVASVPAKVIYAANSERLEFPLQTMQTAPSMEVGKNIVADSGATLVLRFRHATLDDLNFMSDLDREAMQSNTFWSPKAVAGNIMAKRSKFGVSIYSCNELSLFLPRIIPHYIRLSLIHFWNYFGRKWQRLCESALGCYSQN
jgi:hypothetical protein